MKDACNIMSQHYSFCTLCDMWLVAKVITWTLLLYLDVKQHHFLRSDAYDPNNGDADE